MPYLTAEGHRLEYEATLAAIVRHVERARRGGP